MVEMVVFILLCVLWVYDNEVKIIEYNLVKLCEQLKLLGLENLMLKLWVFICLQVWNFSLLKIVELIQVDMVQVGVKVVIVLVEGCFQEVWLMDMSYDLMLFGWVMDSNDLDSFFCFLLSCVVIYLQINFVYWCDLKFDSVLCKVFFLQQLVVCIEVYDEAQSILAQELFILLLVLLLCLQVYWYDIKGLVFSLFGNVFFVGVYCEKQDEVKKL